MTITHTWNSTGLYICSRHPLLFIHFSLVLICKKTQKNKDMSGRIVAMDPGLKYIYYEIAEPAGECTLWSGISYGCGVHVYQLIITALASQVGLHQWLQTHTVLCKLVVHFWVLTLEFILVNNVIIVNFKYHNLRFRVDNQPAKHCRSASMAKPKSVASWQPPLLHGDPLWGWGDVQLNRKQRMEV